MSTQDALNRLLGEFVAASPKQRITLEDIRSHVARADPESLGDPQARRNLRAALDALADGGQLTLPVTTGRKNWDNRSSPALPAWVMRPPRPTRTPAGPTARVWPAALEPAAAIAERPDEFDLLTRIAAWMREDNDFEPVPIEERSLQILGNEKALGRQRSNRLFTSGTLTLDVLRCYEAPLPLASQHVPGSGSTRLLTSENKAGYYSLLRTIRALDPATRPDLHLAWGSGKQFPVSIADVRLLEPPPVDLLYIGDLDLDGLRIACAAARAAQALGLPPLRPAAQMYRWMTRHGIIQPDDSNTGPNGSHLNLIEWLPDDLRTFVADLFHRRERIAQETIGLRILRAAPGLILEDTSR